MIPLSNSRIPLRGRRLFAETFLADRIAHDFAADIHRNEMSSHGLWSLNVFHAVLHSSIRTALTWENSTDGSSRRPFVVTVELGRIERHFVAESVCQFFLEHTEGPSVRGSALGGQQKEGSRLCFSTVECVPDVQLAHRLILQIQTNESQNDHN